MEKIDQLRSEIDKVDDELLILFDKRLALIKEVKEFKQENNLPTLDSKREDLIKERLTKNIDVDLKKYYLSFINNMLSISKEYQNNNNIIRLEESFNIIYSQNCLDKLKSYCDLNKKILFVIDENIYKYVYKRLIKYQNSKFFILRVSEDDKNIEQVIALVEYLLNNEFNRDDEVFAIGGGVTTDLVGFACSIFKRGIKFNFIPTTLLGMVDASIGGKTGVNYNKFKNVIGSFSFPNKIIIDIKMLDTLPKRNFNSGLVECFKIGLTSNKKIVDLILNSVSINDEIELIIRESIKTKLEIVNDDCKENGKRMLLNFGHTIGHAIEMCSNGCLLHGEAVGLGMLYATKGISHSLVLKFLKKYNLPIKHDIEINELMKNMENDKKIRNNCYNFIICEDVEKYQIVQINSLQLRSILENGGLL